MDVTIERIKTAAEIVKYAIEKNTTVYALAPKFGLSSSFLKDVRKTVRNKYNKGTLDEKSFQDFVYTDNKYTEYKLNKSKSKYDIINFDNVISDDISNVNKKDYLSNKNDLECNSNMPQSESLNYKVNDDEVTIEWKSGSNYPPNHIKTLDDLLKETKVDLNIWKVKDYVVNKWDVTSWKKDDPQTIQNFQVKAKLERDKKEFEERVIGDIFKEMVKDYKPPQLSYNNQLINKNFNTKENNLLEITLFDLHFGKLAWCGETGENYDTKIARERFIETIKTIIKRASGFQYNRILFPVGSDFFNSDTIYNTTTKGTIQDEDLRWQKTFTMGVKLLVDSINLMKQTGLPIDVVVIPGNHDYERSYYMGEYLYAWFNNDPLVNINNNATPRKYYRFGNVLIGLTHGSEEKADSLPLLMATDFESKPMWSETKFHEWHVGHYHHKKDVKYVTLDKSKITDENLGVTVRYLSSLTGTEEWHYSKGFVGAIKAGEAFIWNDNAGMIAHLNANITIE